MDPMPWQRWFVRLALRQHARPSGWSWAVMAILLIVPRQNGKGTCLEIIELYCLFSLNLNVYHTAQMMRTSRKAFVRLWGFIDSTPFLRRRVAGKPQQTAEEIVITLTSGAMITYMARSARAARGLDDCDVLVLDEALFLDPKMVDATIPTMTTRRYPLVIYLSSAGVVGSSLLRALQARMQAGDPTITGAEWSIDPDLVRQPGFDPLDPAHLAAANPSFGTRDGDGPGALVTHEYCIGEYAEMTAEGPLQGFLRERLGVPDADPETAQRPIPAILWRDREDPQRKRPDRGRPAFGVAGSWPDADECAVSVAGWRGDELVVQVLRHDPGSDWCVKELVDLARRHQPCSIALDEGGPVGHLVEPLREALKEAGLHRQVKVLTPSPREMAHAAKTFRAAVVGKQPYLRHFAQKPLTDAVLSAGRRPLVDAWYWQRRGDKDISPLESCTLAAWAAGKPVPVPPAAPQSVPVTADTRPMAGDLAEIGF